jgi:hypothetical protein
MSWKSTIAKKQTWKDSIMRSKPITPDDLKAQVLKLVMPEIKEKTSWKNTLSIVPKNGADGTNGKDGKRGPKGEKGEQGIQGLAGKDGINGTNGVDGINGTNGSQILFLDEKPTDEGNDGDLVLINKTFELFYKENGEWIKKGTLLGKNAQTAYVGGLNGASAYEIAVRNGFAGTEVEWLASLGSAQVEYAQIIDEASSTVTYVGKADPGSSEASAVWQIKKITVSGTETIITWADGDVNFNNVWDNRAGLSFS